MLSQQIYHSQIGASNSNDQQSQLILVLDRLLDNCDINSLIDSD